MRDEEALGHVPAVEGRAGGRRVLVARAEVAGVHPEVVARAPDVQPRRVAQQHELGHDERVVLGEARLRRVDVPARGHALVLHELGRADGGQALEVGEVRVQVIRRHVDDVHAALVDVQVLLELGGDEDHHLEAAVEDDLEAAVVLVHAALEVLVAGLAALEVEQARHPDDVVGEAAVACGGGGGVCACAGAGQAGGHAGESVHGSG